MRIQRPGEPDRQTVRGRVPRTRNIRMRAQHRPRRPHRNVATRHHIPHHIERIPAQTKPSPQPSVRGHTDAIAINAISCAASSSNRIAELASRTASANGPPPGTSTTCPAARPIAPSQRPRHGDSAWLPPSFTTFGRWSSGHDLPDASASNGTTGRSFARAGVRDALDLDTDGVPARSRAFPPAPPPW